MHQFSLLDAYAIRIDGLLEPRIGKLRSVRSSETGTVKTALIT